MQMDTLFFLLNNDDSIYFDTIYRLNFIYDLDDTQKDFELYVMNDPLGSLSKLYPKISISEEEYCNTAYIDNFCIPRSDKVNNNVGDDEGIFQSNLHLNIVNLTKFRRVSFHINDGIWSSRF